MEMTMKELADELGVSKDKVKYQVRKIPSYYLVKRGNVTYLTEQGIWHVKKLLGKKVGNFPPSLPTELPTQEREKIRALENRIAELELELRLKGESWERQTEILNEIIAENEKRIERMDADNEKMHRLLDQEQQLRMAEMKKHILEIEEKQEKPKGFWKKFFGKGD